MRGKKEPIILTPMSEFEKKQIIENERSISLIYDVHRIQLELRNKEEFDQELHPDKGVPEIQSMTQWTKSLSLALNDIYTWVSTKYLDNHLGQAKSAHTLLYLLDYYKGRYDQLVERRLSAYIEKMTWNDPQKLDLLNVLIDTYLFDFYEIADKFKDVINILLSDNFHTTKKTLLRPYWTSFERWSLITFDNYLERCRKEVRIQKIGDEN